jgi:hypothetical protein
LRELLITDDSLIQVVHDKVQVVNSKTNIPNIFTFIYFIVFITLLRANNTLYL